MRKKSRPSGQTHRRQHNYFENLEKRIKITFAVYLTLFTSGMAIVVVGPEQLFEAVVSSTASTGITLLLVAGMLAATFTTIGKVYWLGDMHVRLDRMLFGFLPMSNDTIFLTLASSVTSEEQQLARELSTESKGAMTQSLFRHLANDRAVFNDLLDSDIFSSWIWYWMALYGTSVFSVLSVMSFLSAWSGAGEWGRVFFAIMWVLALLHLSASIALGRYLIRRTRRVVEQIVALHHDQVARVLRVGLHGAPDVIAPEVTEEEYDEDE